MPHFHSIDGYSVAAAQYQAYLERIRLAHPSEDAARTRKMAQNTSPQSFIDPDASGEDAPERDPDEGTEQQPDEEKGPDGFGNHYA